MPTALHSNIQVNSSQCWSCLCGLKFPCSQQHPILQLHDQIVYLSYSCPTQVQGTPMTLL
jgi:hypothetical protein